MGLKNEPLLLHYNVVCLQLCFIYKYFQPQCNFVQLLQVFIDNWMKGRKRRTFKTTVAIMTRGFGVESYCSFVSVAKAWKPKNTQTSAQGLGEIFSFLFLYNLLAFCLLFLKCFNLCWKKNSCQTASTVSSVISHLHNL